MNQLTLVGCIILCYLIINLIGTPTQTQLHNNVNNNHSINILNTDLTIQFILINPKMIPANTISFKLTNMNYNNIMNILNTDTIVQILLKFDLNTPDAPELLSNVLNSNQNNILNTYDNCPNIPNTNQLVPTNYTYNELNYTNINEYQTNNDDYDPLTICSNLPRNYVYNNYPDNYNNTNNTTCTTTPYTNKYHTDTKYLDMANTDTCIYNSKHTNPNDTYWPCKRTIIRNNVAFTILKSNNSIVT